MAFQADFFTLTKKRNSTLQPTGTGSFSLSVTLNDASSSLLYPAIRLRIPSDAILQCNYVHITKFSRYYYIDDWTYNADGTWTASCSVDVLASWKAAIISSPGYIGRAENASIQNQYALDTYYPATNLHTTYRQTIDTGMSGTPLLGTFVIGVMSKDSPNLGAISYYAIQRDQLATMMSNMMATAGSTVQDWRDTDSITGDVLKTIVNPIQYITSCKWFPFSIPNLSYNTAINLGGWATGATGAKIESMQRAMYGDLTISSLPGFLDYPPYARYSFISPIFGTFDLDPTVIAQNKNITWTIDTNLATGGSVLTVKSYRTSGESRYLYELFRSSTMLAVDIPITQLGTNYVGIAKTAISTVAGAADWQNWITSPGSQVANIANGLIDAATMALSPSVQSTGGSINGFVFDVGMMYVQQIRYGTVDQSDISFGKPVKKYVANLTNITGFVQYDVSLFNGACTSTEKDMIITFLEGGAYIE